MIGDLALLTARTVFGKSFAAHGTQKAWGWFEGPGPEGAAKFLESLGFKPGDANARLAAWNEIVAGELIFWGLGGPIGPAIVIAQMLVGAISVHAENGYFAQKNGVEVPVLYAAGALALAGSGYGAISLDRLFRLQGFFRHPVVLALVLAGGAAAGAVALSTRELPQEDTQPAS